MLCFLHEADLAEGGADGTGLIWIEHQQLKGASEERRNDYGNCLLSCRFCNNGRSKIPATEKKTGAKLLDPTQVAWNSFFQFSGSVLVVRDPRDDDAQYTWRVYALGHERKSALRENRRRRFDHFAKAKLAYEELLPELARTAGDLTKNEQERGLAVVTAEAIASYYEASLSEIGRYLCVPHDRPMSCECRIPSLVLPEWLAQQTYVVTP